ncbi:MAG: phosphatidylserine decarboxylase [Acetobacteraceae bacterium]
MTLADSLKAAFPPPHRVGWPFVGGGIVVFVLGLLISKWLAVLGLAFALFCLFFFRNPTRTPPSRPGVIVAPADGRITAVSMVAPPVELGMGDMPRWRVSVFLSVLNVHANRMPIAGTVTRIAYRHGAFVNASLDKASAENERNAVAIRLDDGRDLAYVQIAGLIARRILCFVAEGDRVSTGGICGFIRFGSRTDVYLPEGVAPLVELGQTMVGGETVIAEMTDQDDHEP